MATEAGADIAYFEMEIKPEPVDKTDCMETQQILCNAKVKEEPVDQYADCGITDNVAEELYKDHIIKQDMVIGPVVLQESCPPNNKDISEESTKTQTKSKANKKLFTQKKYVSRHVINQRREKQLDLRKRNLTGEMSHQCKKCKETFDNKIDLTRHKLIHTDSKPLSCKVCKKTFTFKGNLTRHEIVHSGEKPFGCDICQKKFSRKNYLITHVRFHTGDKPFRCELCKKDFTLKSNLTKHERTHTSVQKLCCKVCQKPFTGKCYLTRHERSHTGDKPYSCKVCQRKFLWKSSVIQHERSHTNVPKDIFKGELLDFT